MIKFVTITLLIEAVQFKNFSKQKKIVRKTC